MLGGMFRSGPRSRHFASRIMRLQFLVIGILIVLVTAGTLYASYDRVYSRAEDTSLTIARSVAVLPDVIEEVTRYAAIEDLDEKELSNGKLQQLANAILEQKQAYFVVITEDRGLRLSHPNPAEIGQMVSTDPVALDGIEAVSREHGTLGESVRAKVPIRGESGQIIGEVSVGVTTQSLTGALLQSFSWIVLFALLAAGLATVAGRVTVRRLKRQTLGLEPTEIAQLVRDQQAVLYGVTEGVMGIGADRRITVRNKAARQLLGLPHRTELQDVVGRHFESAGLDQRLVKAMLDRQPSPYTDAELISIAMHCNLQESAGQKVERAMRKRAAAVALANSIGKLFHGVITGVSDQGVYVRVFQPPVEGRILRGEHGLEVGDTVNVTLLHTDPQRAFIDFAVA